MKRREPFCRRVPSSPSLRAGGWEFVLCAAVLLWTFLLACTPMQNTDIWWHLRTGQLMLQRGTVPLVDWYTFTDADKLWIDLHWGFQLLVTALYWLGGVDLLVLSKAFCTAAAVAIGWFAAGKHLPAWTKAACWTLPIICISGRALVRPEMLSLIFLALWLWLISRLHRKPGLIWWLPVLQLLWVNCHGLFVLGLVVGAAYVADRIVRQIARGRSCLELEGADNSPPAIYLFCAGVLVLLACLVNPYFEAGALFPLELYRKFSVEEAFYSMRIGEFRPPLAFVRQYGWKTLTNLYLMAEFGLWLAVAASFVWLARERRVSMMRLLLFAGFSHLAWKASRNTNLFAMVSGFILCANVGDAWRLYQGKRKKEKGKSLLLRDRGAQFTFCLLPFAFCLLLIVVVVTGRWGVWSGEGKRFGLGEAKGWYIHAAAQFAGQPGFPQRAIVANIGQAAVYSFHNGPERKVLMDGRLEVCSRRTFEFYESILDRIRQGDRSWQNEPILRDVDGNLPVVILDSRGSRPQINALYSTPGWRLVFADPAAAVFLEERLAKRLNLPVADFTPLMYPPGVKMRIPDD